MNIPHKIPYQASTTSLPLSSFVAIIKITIPNHIKTMFIPSYSLSQHKTINNDTLAPLNQAPLSIQYKSFQLPSAPLTHFDNLPYQTILDNINQQLSFVEEALPLQVTYDLITKASAKETLEQYQRFYIQDHLVFEKQLLIKYINQLHSQHTLNDQTKRNETTEAPDSFVATEPEEPPRSIQPTHQLYQISRQAIRDITHYTYTPIPPFATPPLPTYIHWQYLALRSKADRLVINWSRQMGKSLILAELLTEESFTGIDILVAWPQQDTTDIIKNYMLQHTQHFPDNTFIYKERKKYIENTISGSRIHFRTLEDNGKNIRWLTVSLTVIDEAQLASRKVIEEVVEPTMTTTGGRLILIGTPSEDLSSYMYYVIESVLHQTRDFNTPTTFSAEVITVSADDNPMMHPRFRNNINSKRHIPSIKREYYNHWGKLDDSLFNPTTILPHEIDRYIPLEHYQYAQAIIGIDPARTSDRSAYSVNITYKQKTLTIESWFVPDHYKNNWKEQATFFISLQTKIKQLFPHHPLLIVLDKTWVGDAVAPIFKDQGLHLTHLIQYTAGSSINEEDFSRPKVIRLGKSELINNYLNFVSSQEYAILKTENDALINEIRHIQLTETSQGNMAIRSKDSHYDDITNATMTSAFIIRHEKLTSNNRFPSSNQQSNTTNPFESEANIFAKRLHNRSQTKDSEKGFL